MLPGEVQLQWFFPPCLSPPLSLLAHSPGDHQVWCVGRCPPQPLSSFGVLCGDAWASSTLRWSEGSRPWPLGPREVSRPFPGREEKFPVRWLRNVVEWREEKHLPRGWCAMGKCSSLHGHFWGPWAATRELGWRHWSRATCLSPVP